MTYRFSDDRKEEVRQATDLHDLVSRYLDLRRSGRNFTACCPFHKERTPSFYVYPDTQRWKCYGCQKGGDVFAFVMEREAVDFAEALRMLARERGIELAPPAPEEEGARKSREVLFDVVQWACRWFQGNLKGSPAADYLRGRHLDGTTALQWRLGYAPDGWVHLLEAATGAGIDASALEAAGLVRIRESGGGHYDVFRNRVLFPIADVRGRVVAFGARVLGEGEPKYLNSPETALFRKGRMLFGLDRARDAAREQGCVLVMEGYMDVIMAHQHGFRHAVAGLGTAFTSGHAQVLRRFAPRVVLVYDGDAAGRRAAARAAEILVTEEVDATVALLPAGKDPCDLLVEGGPAALEAVLGGARDVLDHLVDEGRREHSDGGRSGTAAAADALLRIVLGVPNRVRRVEHLRRIALGLGLPEEALRHRARELGVAPAAAEAGTPAAARSAPRAVLAGMPPRERMLVQAALVGPGLAGRLGVEAPPGSFGSEDMGRIAAVVIDTAGGDGSARPADCAAALEAEGRTDLADIVTELSSRGGGLDAAAVVRQFDDCVTGLSMERRLEEARRAFAAASGDVAEESRWLAEIQRLESERMRATRPAKG